MRLPTLIRLLVSTLALLAAAGTAMAQTAPTWTSVSHGLTGYGPLVGVAYGNGIFVANENGTNGTVRYATSTDGTTWTARSVAAPGNQNGTGGVAFINGKFVFLTQGFTQTISYVSTDGINWTAGTPYNGVVGGSGFATDGTRVLHISGSSLISSTDLLTWTAVPVAPATGLFSYLNLSYGAGRWYLSTNGGGAVFTSTDGTTWTAAGSTLPNASGGTRVYYGQNVWLAYSQFDHRTSADGTTFTVRGTTSIPIGSADTHVLSDRFILPASRFYTSTDGITWSDFGAMPAVAGFFSLPGIASGGGKIVAAGSINFTSAAILATDAPEVSAPPTPTPQSQSVAAGGSVTLGTTATGTIQWQRNGTAISGATSATLALTNVQPADAGVYSALITSGGTTTTQSAVLGVTSTSKVIGTGSEVGSNITPVPGGNTYDQILLQGAAATITADAGQITRISYIDLSNDIVQVEFSGAGTLSLVLDNPTGPAAPANYNQSVSYMKGHASIVITGANETSNVTVFTVGTATAVNQALFKSITYDGVADLASIAIQSPTGKFGGLRAANASFLATKGYTGVYAPDIQFTGPVYVGDITASDAATPVLVIGSATGETRITGGDLLQSNGAAVTVAGLTQLRFTAGTNSHSVAYAAQNNRAVLRQGTTDVTSTLVVNPTTTGGSTGGTVSGPELTYFASGSNPPYTNGEKKRFEGSLTTLRFDSTTLTNPTAMSLSSPYTGARFTDAATGLTWELILNNGAIHEINVMRSGTFVGQWD